MCHLNNLTVARQSLPLPGDLKHIWSDVNKVINKLHIKNRKDTRCHQLYSTKQLREELLEANTISCKQTFAWLILSAQTDQTKEPLHRTLLSNWKESIKSKDQKQNEYKLTDIIMYIRYTPATT